MKSSPVTWAKKQNCDSKLPDSLHVPRLLTQPQSSIFCPSCPPTARGKRPSGYRFRCRARAHLRYLLRQLRNVSCQIYTLDCILRTRQTQLQTLASRLQTPSHPPQTVACKLRTHPFRLQTRVSRLRTQQLQLQTLSRQLQPITCKPRTPPHQLQSLPHPTRLAIRRANLAPKTLSPSSRQIGISMSKTQR